MSKRFKLMPGSAKRELKGTRPKKTLIFAFGMTAAVLLASCSPRATITLPPEGGDPAGVIFGATVTPTTETLIKKLTGAGAGSGSAGAGSSGEKNAAVSIFDAAGITASLKAAGLGVNSVKTEGSSLAVSAAVPKPEGLLAGAVSVKPGERAFRLTVDRNAVNAAMKLMPASTRDYLDLLMAPVFTGEAMTAGEYRDLVGAAYGKTLSGELAASRFTLTVQAPSPVKTAAIDAAGTTAEKSGNTATFTIPLVDLLVLEEDLSLSVTW